MRHSFITSVSLAAAGCLLASTSVQAAVTTRFIQRGDSATLSTTTSVPGNGGGCSVDTQVNISAATIVDRVNGTSGSAVSGIVRRQDSCQQVLEFGSFDVPLTAQNFQIDREGASLNIIIPVSLDQFSSDGSPTEATINRTLTVALEFEDLEGERTAVRTRSRLSTPNLKLTSKGTSILNFAVVTGQLLLDGRSIFTPDTSFGFLERSTTSVVEMTR